LRLVAKSEKRKKGKEKGAKKAAKAAKKAAKRSRGGAKAKAPAKARKASSLDALAKRIVAATQSGELDLRELYAEGCVSVEASGDTANGIAGLEQKLARWQTMQTGTRWKPRHVWTSGNTICIEWDAEVDLRDGRTVPLPEVAIHEVKDGKIVSERYYYNPLALAPAAAGSAT
jgi:ketosteroid isomerase-like protein